MNYEDNQPIFNNSEIGLIDMGLIDSNEPERFRNKSRKDLIEMLIELSEHNKSSAFMYLYGLPSHLQPVGFHSHKSLRDMFGLTNKQAKDVIRGFQLSSKGQTLIETADYVFNLDGTVREPMTDDMREAMLTGR